MAVHRPESVHETIPVWDNFPLKYQQERAGLTLRTIPARMDKFMSDFSPKHCLGSLSR